VLLTKIIIADDHKIVRDGLSSLIEKQPEMELLGQAKDGRETLSMVRSKQPDVVIMDISMPILNGIDATRAILEEFPDIRIIILSMHSDKRFITGALKAGASGYLLKECAFKELRQALKAVTRGQTYLSPQIAQTVVSEFRSHLDQFHSDEQGQLTTKEREVLQLIAEGHPTKEIAERLFVSIKTVEARRRRIMEKLSIKSVPGLVKYAIREGLTEL
jgi:DNA-binding NarL/FixJ family response regulator